MVIAVSLAYLNMPKILSRVKDRQIDKFSSPPRPGWKDSGAAYRPPLGRIGGAGGQRVRDLKNTAFFK